MVNIEIRNEMHFINPEIIIVANYFNPDFNKIINWWLDKNYLLLYKHQDDIGVWKIKHLKK